MKNTKKRTKDKGITLVALVVTIITLLILAGVTISLVLGQQGIFNKAEDVKTKTEIANEKEQVQLAILEARTNTITDNTKDLKTELTKSIQSAFGNTAKVEAKADYTGYIITLPNGNQYEVDNNGIITKYPGEEPLEPEVPALSDELTYKEGSVEEGLVVTDTEGNEFVWIPVAIPVIETEAEITTMVGKGKYPMAVETVGMDKNGRQNYRGVLYDFVLDTEVTPNKVKVTAKLYSPMSGNREPANLDAGYDNTTNIPGWTETLYQEEYNQMIEKVKTNGGFYIGRYETSYNGSKVESKQGKEPMVAADNSQKWYGMYEKQKGLTNSAKNVVSHMIWGSQYDQVMIKMKEVENTGKAKPFYILDSTDMGNYTGVRTATGSSINNKVKNIYDLAGNVYEWTTEANVITNRVLRGGYYYLTYGSIYPTSSSVLNNPNNIYINYGSRLTLY